MKMTKHSLSLCMIVKDEEETIGRAIKSALAVVDEVVVVDTGSTDNTRLIVEGYGARVVDFPWCDDFSAAHRLSRPASCSARSCRPSPCKPAWMRRWSSRHF
jgi:glycosyltransferase involved in cell wall biosynthesis